jgi:glycerol-3-phosphate cytidylyltransferase
VARRVITYGTFDLFHIGHLNILERLRALGGHLAVGISTDAFNATKGKKSVIPYVERVAIVRALRCVDEVFPEETWEQKPGDIKRLRIDTFGMGDDWRGKFDHLSEFCEVVYLPRTEGVSTTFLLSEISVKHRPMTGIPGNNNTIKKK